MSNGLYANINAKRARIAAGSGEKMRAPGSKGAPTDKSFCQSKKTAKKPVKKMADGGPSYGKRLDKTEKGRGWLGEHLSPKGKIVTEMSVGVNLGGKERLLPAMVPGLTRGQVERLVSGKFNPKSRNPEDTAIMRRAVAHAKRQLTQGRSPFKD